MSVARYEDTITIETDLFNHREVKPHFINDCCFGEDFAAWLKQQLSPLVSSGFKLSESIQEDYGWGFWASRGGTRFWVALSYVGEGPQETPAEWVISVNDSLGFNFLSRVLHGEESRLAFRQLRDQIWATLRSNGSVRILQK